MRLDFQVEGRVHIHDHCFDPLPTRLIQAFKEGADRLAAAPRANPQHLAAQRFNDHRGITVPLLQGKLVHAKILDAAPIGLADLLW